MTQRLKLHQDLSRPILDDLHRWMREQFVQKKVEPNSTLGGAFNYLLNHWEPLTLFLRVAGAPLDRACPEIGKPPWGFGDVRIPPAPHGSDFGHRAKIRAL